MDKDGKYGDKAKQIASMMEADIDELKSKYEDSLDDIDVKTEKQIKKEAKDKENANKDATSDNPSTPDFGNDEQSKKTYDDVFKQIKDAKDNNDRDVQQAIDTLSNFTADQVNGVDLFDGKYDSDELKPAEQALDSLKEKFQLTDEQAQMLGKVFESMGVLKPETDTSDVDKVKDDAKEAVDDLNEITGKQYKIDFDTTDPDKIQQQLNEISSEVDKHVTTDSEGNPHYDESQEGAVEAEKAYKAEVQHQQQNEYETSAMGRINTSVLGVANGTMARQLNTTTAKTAYITLNFATTDDCAGIEQGKTYSGSSVGDLKMMMYEVNLNVNGATKNRPVGIRMSSYNEDKKSSIDIYNGTVDDGRPVARMGALDGLPAVNGTNPTGYGFYAAGNAYFNGTLVSSSGKIGGFTISQYTLVNNNGSNTVGMCSTDGYGWAFWAGASSGGNAPFHVGHNGGLYASNANITGTINASSLTAKQYYKIYDSDGKNERTFVSWSGSMLSFGLVSQNGSNEAEIQILPGSQTVTFNGDIGATQGTIYAGSIDATGSLSVRKTARMDILTFYDYQQDTLPTASDMIYRRPIASAASNNGRVAFLQGASGNKISIRAQYGKSDFSSATFTASSSDIRLKEDVKDSSVNALSKIMQMQIREFNWKQTGVHQELGCVADELELIDPLLTTGGGYDDDGTMNIKSIDTLLLSEYAIKGIQELYKQNKHQQKRIEYLESQLKNK